MQRSGQLDESLDAIPYSDSAEVKNTSHLPPASWKTLLQAKKQSAMENKAKPTSKTDSAHPESFKPNVVKVIDTAYLEKRFHTTKHNDAIDRCYVHGV